MVKWKDGFHRKLTSYGDDAFSLFLRKVFLKSMGYSDDAIDRPIIGITNTYSSFNSCHGTVPGLIEAIKRGVMQAGGIPFDFPVISLHESFAYPTSMYLRNLMAIDTEEMLRAQPLDAVVLIGGCDKTVPALLMGAASADVPAIMVVTGPMLTGDYQGERVGACTDCRRFWGRYRAGEADQTDMDAVSDQLAPTPGTCMVMGTASTMALTTQALGMMLPGGATIPAVYSERFRHAERSGSQAVTLAKDSLCPSQILTPAAFGNALRVLLAVGGSTNAIIHLTAMAGRCGIEINLDEFDRLGRDTPMLVDLKPSGNHYMQELHAAGGFQTLLRELAPLLDLDCTTVTGSALGAELDAAAPAWSQDVVKPMNDPVYASASMVVLRGNIAPDGAVLKQAAATASLLQHRGRAIVFDSVEDLAERIDDPALDVEAEDILVMRNAGPKGAPGMPEAGYLPIPKKLAQRGVKDMVRISDARMSGTAFGTIILHVAPESAVGGPLALLKSGDVINLDTAGRRLDVEIGEDEMAARRDALDTRADSSPLPERGYARLLQQEMLQADEGCDFGFLRPAISRDLS